MSRYFAKRIDEHLTYVVDMDLDDGNGPSVTNLDAVFGEFGGHEEGIEAAEKLAEKLNYLESFRLAHASLKAEVERLRKVLTETDRLLLIDGEYEAAKVGTYAKLKAEVERLTKLCQATSPDGFIHIRDIKHHPIMGPAWERRESAAKEGKQP